MDIGIICPPSKIRHYSKSRFHYALPTYLINNKVYLRFMLEKLGEGENVFIDLIKPGKERVPESIEVIEKVLDLIWPTDFIMPSYSYKHEETMSLCEKLKTDYRIEGYIVPELMNKEKIEEMFRHKKVCIPRHLSPVVQDIDLRFPIYIEHKSPYALAKKERGIFFTSMPIALGIEGRLLKYYRPCPSTCNWDIPIPELQEKMIMTNIFDLIDYYIKDEE
jgi:hypothetical protein